MIRYDSSMPEHPPNQGGILFCQNVSAENRLLGQKLFIVFDRISR